MQRRGEESGKMPSILESRTEKQLIVDAYLREMNLSQASSMSKNRTKDVEEFLTEDETEDISVTWDYLVGHVGLKTLGSLFINFAIRKEFEVRRKNDISENMEEILFPKRTNLNFVNEEERIKADIEERGLDLAILVDKRVKQARKMFRQTATSRFPVSHGEFWNLEVKMVLCGTGFKRVPLGELPDNYMHLTLSAILETILDGLSSNSRGSPQIEDSWYTFLEIPRRRRTSAFLGRTSTASTPRESRASALARELRASLVGGGSRASASASEGRGSGVYSGRGEDVGQQQQQQQQQQQKQPEGLMTDTGSAKNKNRSANSLSTMAQERERREQEQENKEIEKPEQDDES